MNACVAGIDSLIGAQACLLGGKGDHEAVFNGYFRSLPFKGGFVVCAGTDQIIETARNMRFTAEDISYLMEVDGPNGKPIFTTEFLRYLRNIDKLDIQVSAVDEGTVLFPNEPMFQVRGNIIHAQLVEEPFLQAANFSSLDATKAARICLASHGKPVVEIGFKRVQGGDFGLSASRACYIGGCVATSSVIAGRTYGIPVSGSHAHALTMFTPEYEAFENLCRAQPGGTTLLVDTYDTIAGTREAAKAIRKISPLSDGTGYCVRLDSGDLYKLSCDVKAILDAANLPKCKIMVSGDLDEYKIAALESQKAPISVYAVGTAMVTGDGGNLRGVYKLVASRPPEQMMKDTREYSVSSPWTFHIKTSQDPGKTTYPGILQTRRFYSKDSFLGDVIFCEQGGSPNGHSVLPDGSTWATPHNADYEDLLRIYWGSYHDREASPLAKHQARTRQQLAMLPKNLLTLTPETFDYPVTLDTHLAERRTRMIRERGE